MITHIRLFPLTQWWFSPAKQGLFFTLLLCVLLLKPSIHSLIQLWLYDDNYNHGFFILFISLYFWGKDSDFFHIKNPLRSPFALLAFCCLYIIYLISVFLSIDTLAYFMIPFLIAFCIRIFSPTLSWKSVFFPAFFLFFALPVWNILHAPLQNLTILFCEYALYFFHIPFYIDGTTITTSEGYFDVETGCSGLRYLIVMLAFFYLKEKDSHSKTIMTSIGLFLLAVFLAIATNWIRVLTIILIGYQTKMQHSIVTHHDLLGWVLFILFFVAYLFISHQAQSHHPISKKVTAPTQTTALLFSNHRPFYFLMAGMVLFMLIPSQFLLSPTQNHINIEKFEITKNTQPNVEFPASSQLKPKDWLTIDQTKIVSDVAFLPHTFKTLITTLHQPSDVYQPRITHFIEKNHPDLSLTLYKIDFKTTHQLDYFFNLPAISAVFPKNIYQHTPAPIAKDFSMAKETISAQPQVILQSSLYINNENNEKTVFQHKWQLLKKAFQGEVKSLEFSLYIYHCISSCDWLQSQLESEQND